MANQREKDYFEDEFFCECGEKVGTDGDMCDECEEAQQIDDASWVA